jgi:hypothetical protein
MGNRKVVGVVADLSTHKFSERCSASLPQTFQSRAKPIRDPKSDLLPLQEMMAPGTLIGCHPDAPASDQIRNSPNPNSRISSGLLQFRNNSFLVLATWRPTDVCCVHESEHALKNFVMIYHLSLSLTVQLSRNWRRARKCLRIF